MQNLLYKLEETKIRISKLSSLGIDTSSVESILNSVRTNASKSVTSSDGNGISKLTKNDKLLNELSNTIDNINKMIDSMYENYSTITNIEKIIYSFDRNVSLEELENIINRCKILFTFIQNNPILSLNGSSNAYDFDEFYRFMYTIIKEEFKRKGSSTLLDFLGEKSIFIDKYIKEEIGGLENNEYSRKIIERYSELNRLMDAKLSEPKLLCLLALREAKIDQKIDQVYEDICTNKRSILYAKAKLKSNKKRDLTDEEQKELKSRRESARLFVNKLILRLSSCLITVAAIVATGYKIYSHALPVSHAITISEITYDSVSGTTSENIYDIPDYLYDDSENLVITYYIPDESLFRNVEYYKYVGEEPFDPSNIDVTSLEKIGTGLVLRDTCSTDEAYYSVEEHVKVKDNYTLFDYFNTLMTILGGLIGCFLAGFLSETILVCIDGGFVSLLDDGMVDFDILKSILDDIKNIIANCEDLSPEEKEKLKKQIKESEEEYNKLLKLYNQYKKLYGDNIDFKDEMVLKK